MNSEPDRMLARGLVAGAAGLLFLMAIIWASGFRPPVLADAAARPAITVESGQGAWEIAGKLKEAGVVRSRIGFMLVALATGAATKLKPGVYQFDPAESVMRVARALKQGVSLDVAVTVPEGASIYAIDQLLAQSEVLAAGELIAYAAAAEPIEGRLFPDTYRFYRGSAPAEVVRKMTENFAAKAAPLLPAEAGQAEEILILASIVEKEVPLYEDRRQVAGILKKRLAAEVPLQADATICYVKYRMAGEYGSCLPITRTDLALDSAHNTYLHKDLPPSPIGNPGLAAIRAVQDAQSTPYWYYLSDPATGQTIFASTLEEHNRQKKQYLGGG